MRLRNFSLGAAILLISTGLGQSVNATIPASEPEQAPSITSCIAKHRKLEALMVVDESVSLIRAKGPGGKLLPGTDMNDDRVTALKAVTQVLLDKVKDSDPERQTRVSVALAGFGNGYTEHQSWMDLTTGSASKFLEVIDEQASRETSQYTRYHLALKGALATFSEKETKDGATCRMLIWFSDGQHDDNDSGKVMSSTEESQVRKTICGPNGSADQLRLQGVYTVAAGLNENKSSLGLMKLVSQGDGDIKLKSEVLTSCGDVKPEGRFAVASGAGDLVETLVTLIEPDIGNPDLQPCDDGQEECSQISFIVSSQVSKFTLFVDRGDDEVEATLESEQTGETKLFGKVVDRNIEQTLLSDNGAYVRVSRKQDGLINGRWTLKFRGENHAQGRALVRFVGEASVKLVSVQPDGKIGSAKSVDRFDTEALRVGVTAKTGGAVLDGARLEFKTRDGLVELKSYTEDGELIIPVEELQRVLRQNPQLRDALEAELVVTPLGSVEGISDPKTGRNMPIDFGEFPFKLRLTNGSGFPEYLGLDKSIEGVDATGHPIFKGTNKKTVGFRFKGASASDSVVTFENELKSDIGLKFISGQECVVKKAVERTCELELKPSKSSNGSHPAVVRITSAVKGSSETQTGEIPLDLETQLPSDAGRGLNTALILILSFFVIQGVQRYFFAWLITRYAPLNPTARRVRLDVTVDVSGSLSIDNRSEVAVTDESFTFDNIDSTLGFDAFGYSFKSSPLRTFLHSTSSPNGLVSREGRHVIGSAGLVTSKKETSAVGLVDLALRGQWVLGIESSEAQAWMNGIASISAELVVFLEPYEKKLRADQLADLEFTIASSNLNQFVTSLIENLNSKAEVIDEVSSEVVDVFSTPNADVFGTWDSDSDLSTSFEEKSSKKSRIGKRKRKDTDDGGSLPPFVGPSDDPFA